MYLVKVRSFVPTTAEPAGDSHTHKDVELVVPTATATVRPEASDAVARSLIRVQLAGFVAVTAS
uniref:Uncharacterized protein n=1 Tax=uncultured marine virus TaxID=186617 RepID=A0A0F7L9Q4_9VIRU|nr:hypothetical protein [uncultured marine virus]